MRQWKTLGAWLFGGAGAGSCVLGVVQVLSFIINLPGMLVSIKTWQNEWLPATGDFLSVAIPLVIGVALLFVSSALVSSANKDKRVIRREIYDKGLDILKRYDRWKLRTRKTISVEDEYDYIKRQPEYHILRPYLGKEPSLQVFNVTQTGGESAFITWFRQSIDNLAKQWGLIEKHKKTHRKKLK